MPIPNNAGKRKTKPSTHPTYAEPFKKAGEWLRNAATNQHEQQAAIYLFRMAAYLESEVYAARRTKQYAAKKASVERRGTTYQPTTKLLVNKFHGTSMRSKLAGCKDMAELQFSAIHAPEPTTYKRLLGQIIKRTCPHGGVGCACLPTIVVEEG